MIENKTREKLDHASKITERWHNRIVTKRNKYLVQL